jgi:cobyrinic acid a,c-diamide synthase
MAENHKYDLIISDAYTGQNIPLHLLSFEAINVFMSKLTPEGILCMHISSNTKEALYNIAKVAEVMGLECLHQYYDLQSKPQGKEAHLGLFPVGKQSEIIKITEICKRILHYFLDLHKLFPAEHHTSRCIILTRDPQNFSKLKDLNKWQKIQIPAGTKLLRDEAISYNPFI